MIRILTNERIENFNTILKEYYGTPDSNDGMMRGTSYSTCTEFSFLFENEKKELDGYSYDFSVIETKDRMYNNEKVELTTTVEEFKNSSAYAYITGTLWNKGVVILNIPVAVKIKCKTILGETEDIVKLEIDSDYRFQTVHDNMVTLTASELLARVKEQDAMRKAMKIARAVGDITLLKTTYNVLLSSLIDSFDEFYEKTIRLEKVTINSLIESKTVDEADIKQFLADFIARISRGMSYYKIDIDQIDGSIIASLSEELRSDMLRLCI